MISKKIVVGMSGGIDSCMALVLLKKQGWSPVGLSLKYSIWQSKENLLRENVCCTQESLNMAKNMCKKLGVPHYMFDVRKSFESKVVTYFIKELNANRTPNPCLICNRDVKFTYLFDWANRHKIQYVATGHYAKIEKNDKSQRYELKRAKDEKKDQSYNLSFLPEKWLRYIIFPLGQYTKKEVYQMAKKEKLNDLLYLKESQNFCFVAEKSINNFLTEKIGINPGIIKDENGTIIGTHQGLHFYTIGQRKGIKLPHGPYFVCKKEKATNTLFITKNNKELYQQKAILSPYFFTCNQPVLKRMRIQTKIRYHQKLTDAMLIPICKNKLKIIFAEPQKAITPGQLAVFYQKNICLGGGIIDKV